MESFILTIILSIIIICLAQLSLAISSSIDIDIDNETKRDETRFLTSPRREKSLNSPESF